jgi:GNAT superfamily N-acetyltransferase
MNRHEVLAAYDEQVRRRPEVDGPRVRVERTDGIVRVVSPGQGWRGVTWSDVDEVTADGAIAAQVVRFAEIPGGWEWKYYSYDRPPDLPDRLLAAGFRPEPLEALMVAEVAELQLDVPAPAGVRLLPVVDGQGIDALVAVHDEVFGGDPSWISTVLAAALDQQPGAVAAVVAMAGERPVGAGRVELPRQTEFASIWGGGVVPAWRNRGVFRALVAHRAALAAAAGFRYLQVDASADSRPILRRLGFVELATTTPFVHI